MPFRTAFRSLFALPLVVTSNALAQEPLSESTRRMYVSIRDNIVASADLMPDSAFSSRPVATVRTFGQLVAHVANAAFTICSSSLTRPNSHPEDVESKDYGPADLRRLVRDAFRICDDAYARMTDATLAESMGFFGGQQPRHFAMTYHLIHANEHYGNMVTYLRIRRLVPPSSAPR